MYVTFEVDSPNHPTMTSLTIDGPDLAHISRRWLAFAEQEDLGASMVSDGTVVRSSSTEDGDYVGRMSYNGKVWANDAWADGIAQPIYDPRADFVTGDGEAFATVDKAVAHANSVFAKSGRVISVVKRD